MPGTSAARALTLRALRDARVRTVSYAALFGVFGWVQPIAYRNGYPSLASRVTFARAFAGNKAIRLFYGEPHDLLTVGGYVAWRVGGTLAIFAAVFGLLAAVRALRAEEDAGRTEQVLAAPVTRASAYRAALGAILACTAVVWLAEALGLLAGGLPLGGSAYLALATASVIPVCAGAGALACQLAPTRRMAFELGGAVVGLLLLARVVADTAGGAGWLRWATPLGWAEELRPFAHPRPLVLALPVAASALLFACAALLWARRDVGTGLLASRDSAPPRLWLLSSTTAQALRAERTSLLAWLGGAGAFSFVFGVLAKSTASAGISRNLNRELGRLGSGSIVTPSGYLGFTFLFFVLVLSLFACAQVGAARHEELEGRLETVLAQPAGRVRWLGGRLALAVLAAAAIAIVAGLAAWVGVAVSGASVGAGRLLEAGANCLPAALLFGGLAALAYALAPRAAAGVAYGVVAVAFLWYLVGALLGAPHWLVELTPFAHVAAVPAQAFRAAAAAVMVAIAVAAAAFALAAFARRDVLEA